MNGENRLHAEGRTQAEAWHNACLQATAVGMFGRARPVQRLTVEQILRWAREHRRRTGRWPHQHSGPIPSASGLQWHTVDAHLRRGTRGLPGGDSLSRLLARRLKARNLSGRPPLTQEGILAWADAFNERHGRLPTCNGGRIPGTGGETWRGVHKALSDGYRGLPGGSSLARLLAKRRGKRLSRDLPPLTVPGILAWADRHRAETGSWPNNYSGRVPSVPGETWKAVGRALERGGRGLPGGDTLRKLLERERGLPPRKRAPSPPLRFPGMSRPDAERRRLVAELRAEGRTLAEIGEVLGVTRQAVSVMLRRIAEAGAHGATGGAR
jgi:hypothetical protein